MIINKGHLDSIYEVLADKLSNDDIVSSYMQKFPVASNFQYRGGKPSFSTIFYTGVDSSVKLIELSDVSSDSDFLDKVIKDAEELIRKAREERQVLDFYLTKIKSL